MGGSARTGQICFLGRVAGIACAGKGSTTEVKLLR